VAIEDPKDGLDDLIGGDAGTELASNRTDLAFERTRIAADRTLLAVLRTSLSLISFGFTIFQFLGRLADSLGSDVITQEHARNFGTALVVLGVIMLVVGIFVQYRTQSRIRAKSARLVKLGLLRPSSAYWASPTTMFAMLLLLIGLVAMIGMIGRVGPFS
jgi:putative membrane protein